MKVFHTYWLMKMKMKTQCSETLAYKLQTSVNHSEESIQHSEQGESFKSRTIWFTVMCCQHIYIYIYIYIYINNSMTSVRERTIPTERPPPVSEGSANC
jgi:hypothetical protein